MLILVSRDSDLWWAWWSGSGWSGDAIWCGPRGGSSIEYHTDALDFVVPITPLVRQTSYDLRPAIYYLLPSTFHPPSTLHVPGGIRLDETSPGTQTLIHDILKSSLSPEGYAKALGCTWTNAFLGELVGGQGVLNEHSYNFRLFLPESAKSGSNIHTGDEDDDALEDLGLLTRPWGWSFFGHHLCLNVVFVGKRMIVGPTFMGAEPDRIDEGPHAGTRSGGWT
jgi:hypothetical protein